MTYKKLDKNYFEKFVYLNSASPSGLSWKISRGSRKKGSIAGSLHKTENRTEWVMLLEREQWKCSRIVYVLSGNELQENQVVDHFDQNPLNNNVHNLRAVSSEVNARNAKRYSNNLSGVSGVRLHIDKKPNSERQTEYWDVSWKEGEKRKHKLLLCSSHSFDEAVQYRKNKLAELGVGYTTIHGGMK